MMEAYFVMEQLSKDGSIQRFVFKLIDANKILHARRVISGEELTRVHLQGIIVQSSVDYNPGWEFHLEPSTVDFFENQIEVCDANLEYIKHHLDEVGGSFLPRSIWCPWSSSVIEECSMRS
ncbi:calmodulin [Pseudomonas umsongensis]|jgi:hypothetical protein|nr:MULTISPECIES: hypothetical protein [Pseudomonas]MBU0520762.1 calmodulin [Gammaproteobacteria bacterium]MBU0844536.1 calmodulin [Gammaproteobacteria bacterium]MBU1840178.1 calmodulin [Gammaproteobacteria bacterium]QFG27849.1 calmodulin [Pseudomonas umsongensis]